MAATALPLAVRKDIRDTQPKIDEAKKKLDAAFGFEVTLDINNEALFQVLTEGNHSKKESFTTPVVQYLEGLATQIAAITKDPAVKDELTKLVSAKKVTFTVRKDAFKDEEKKVMGSNSYVGVQFKDGALVVVVPVANFWCNMNYISNPKECSITGVIAAACTPAGELPITIRTAIRDAKPKFDEAVKAVGTALGFEVTFELDAKAVYAALPNYKDKIDVAVPRYIAGLAENLAKSCKDDMVKEALLDKFKTKKLGFQIHNGAFADKNKYGGDGYVGLSFDNGDLTIVVPGPNFWSNMDNIKSLKIEKLL